MTLSTAVDRTQTGGDGVTDVFPYLFKAWAQGDIVVIRSNKVEPLSKVTLALGSDYTVEDVGVSTGGTITLIGAQAAAPPEATENITVLRELPHTQTVAVTNQGGFKGNTHETAWDKMVALTQQLKGRLDRCFQVDEVSMADPDSLTYEEMLGRSPILLDSVTGTRVTDLTVYSVSANDFDSMMLEIVDLRGVNTATPRMKFTDLAGTVYPEDGFGHQGLGYNTAGAEVRWNDTGGTIDYAVLTGTTISNSAYSTAAGRIYLTSISAGLYSKYYGHMNWNNNVATIAGRYIEVFTAMPTVLGGCSVYMDSGDISGTLRLWGLPTGS